MIAYLTTVGNFLKDELNNNRQNLAFIDLLSYNILKNNKVFYEYSDYII